MLMVLLIALLLTLTYVAFLIGVRCNFHRYHLLRKGCSRKKKEVQVLYSASIRYYIIMLMCGISAIILIAQIK